MKTKLFAWIRRHKAELYVSVGYGLAATAFDCMAYFSGGDGPLGAWIIMYFIGWPISWVFNQIVARMVDYLPAGIGSFLYGSQVIVAGMLWAFIVTGVLKYLLAKLKTKRQHL